MKAIIYTKTQPICPYCQMAKQYLSEHGISYQEFVYDDYDTRQTMYDELGLQDRERTVPQIFIINADGTQTRIGSYSDLLSSDLTVKMVGDFSEDF